MSFLCSCPGFPAASLCSLFWGRRTVISVSVTTIPLSRSTRGIGEAPLTFPLPNFFRIFPLLFKKIFWAGKLREIRACAELFQGSLSLGRQRECPEINPSWVFCVNSKLKPNFGCGCKMNRKDCRIWRGMVLASNESVRTDLLVRRAWDPKVFLLMVTTDSEYCNSVWSA